MSPIPVLILAAAVHLPAWGQKKTMQLGPHRMELVLERRQGTQWRPVDPGSVFRNGDYVRFRYRTNFDGYLYVMNHGTGGAFSRLFPREDTGLDNRVQAGKEYLVPATDGAFRVEGPPGHDVIYWVITPLETAAEHKHAPLPPPPPPGSPLRQSLKPRCDDVILRARGECVDGSAGPKAVAQAQQLPENIKPYAGDESKELVFFKKENAYVVSSPVPLTGPVVYEFRLAHQ